MTYPQDPHVPEGACGCREARMWRAYWSADQIAQRLREDLQAEQIRHLDRDVAVHNDMRGRRRMGLEPRTWHLLTFAELEKRRAEVAPFPQP